MAASGPDPGRSDGDPGPVDRPPGAAGPIHRPGGRAAVPIAWLLAAIVAFPAAIGLFWLARDSGSAGPLCGDRPGVYYPVCQLPAPFGTGSPPTTRGFQP